jgi:hypothetical protein
MIELQKEFTGTGEVRGFEFKQIDASDNAFLYEVYCPDIDEKHYETFKRKESKDNTSMISGIEVFFAAKVKYPSSADFSKFAFSYRDKNKAIEKFNELTSLKNEN